MALQEKSRTAIYKAMANLAGEEAAADMLAQFPAREYDDPVTKDHLDMRVAELRAELHTEAAGIRTEMADLRTEMADLRTDLRSEIHDSQRTLLMWMVTALLSLIAINSAITFAMLRSA